MCGLAMCSMLCVVIWRPLHLLHLGWGGGELKFPFWPLGIDFLLFIL